MLTAFSCEGFRGLRELRLDGLKRVNLVVGKNNAGKTSLLEAIALGYGPASASDLPRAFRSTQAQAPTGYWRWIISDGAKQAVLRIVMKGTEFTVSVKSNETPQVPVSRGTLLAQVEGLTITSQSHERHHSAKWRAVSVIPKESTEIVKLFGRAMLKSKAEEMLESVLSVVDARIHKVRVLPTANEGNQILVDIGLREMIPISQAGHGLTRLITMFSELIGDQPELCLIDEIENGIHHSVMEDVWKGIAEFAEQFNLQVIATTHSHECLEAAHRAYSQRQNYDFSIVQLFRDVAGVQGRVLDRAHIEAGLNGDIDLRGS